jgi:hypothetical protein
MEEYPDMTFLKADGFDDCLVGVEDSSGRLVYDIGMVISKLITDGLSHEEAWEHFGFNIQGSYVGEQTPIWIDCFIKK